MNDSRRRIHLRTFQTASTFFSIPPILRYPSSERGKDGRWSWSGWLASQVSDGKVGGRGHLSIPPLPEAFIQPNIFLSSLLYIFLGGALNHPTPSFILTRSMAFTYRGRRGEIKMAIRYTLMKKYL